MNNPLLQRVVAEAVGTAVLLAAVVGSGIIGERLAAAFAATALLAWLFPSMQKNADPSDAARRK